MEAVPGWEQKQLAPKPPPLEEGAQLQCHFERQEEKSFPARLSKGLRLGGEGEGEKGGAQETPGHLRAVLCGSGQPVTGPRPTEAPWQG